MQKEQLILSLLLSIFAGMSFSGCSTNGITLGKSASASCEQLMIRESNSISSAAIDYNGIAQEATKKLLEDQNASVVLVTEFVDMTTLHNKNKFGFLMTSYVKNAIINDKPNIIIHEINLADSIKVGSEGTKILTQRIDELSKKCQTMAHYALVGTYTTSPDRVFIAMHLVNLESQIIEKAFTKDFPMTCESKFLFR